MKREHILAGLAVGLTFALFAYKSMAAQTGPLIDTADKNIIIAKPQYSDSAKGRPKIGIRLTVKNGRLVIADVLPG